MKISFRSGGSDSSQNFVESVAKISTFMLYNALNMPLWIGLEYFMPEGTAWTLASRDENDFDKILTTSGILQTYVPGCHFGVPNLLCTPILGKGVPRWIVNVEDILVATDVDVPFFTALKTDSGEFRGMFYRDAEFQKMLQVIWNRQR